MVQMDCPKCGEHEKVLNYAERKPGGVNYFNKCMKCRATFNGLWIPNTDEPSPFEDKEKK